MTPAKRADERARPGPKSICDTGHYHIFVAPKKDGPNSSGARFRSAGETGLIRPPPDFAKSPRKIALRDFVPVRRERAGHFVQRRPVGGDRLLQPPRPALARPERPKRSAEIHLRDGPLERHAIAGPFLECRPVGGDRLLQPRRPALALPEHPERPLSEVAREGASDAGSAHKRS